MQKKEPIDVAVIGMGMDFPACYNVEEYSNILFNGINCTSHLSEDRRNKASIYSDKFNMGLQQVNYQDGSYLQNIDEFDHEFFKILPKEASLMDPVQRKYLQVIVRTIEDAGYSMEALKGRKIGDYVGYTSCSFKDNYLFHIFEENPELIPYSIIGNTTALIPSRIAQLYDFRGPVMVIDTACSSSLVAIYEACKSITEQTSEMALAGGIKLNLMPLDNQLFKLGIESSDAITRVFDDLADGSGIGEGIGAVLLKPLKQAQKDGDRIYAVIKGAAINHDGTALGLTAPNPVSQADVITMAWKQAELNIDQLKYVEMHGTATKLGDPIEFQGLSKAFAVYTDKKQFCAVGSVKSNMGHMFEAAGIAAFIKSVIILNKMVIPPSLNLNNPNNKIQLIDSPMYINTQNTTLEGMPEDTLVGVSAFGLSGTNCHMVLQGYTNRIQESGLSEEDNKKEFVCFSAHSSYSLLENIKEYLARLNKYKNSVSIKRLCYNINTTRDMLSHRIVMYVRSYQELEEGLKKAVIWMSSNQTIKKGVVLNITDQCLFGCYTPNRSKWSPDWELITPDEILNEVVKGKNIDWKEYYPDSCLRLSLPLYHFKPNKFWFEKKKRVTKETSPFLIKQWVRDMKQQETVSYKKALIISRIENKENKRIIENLHNVFCETCAVADANEAAGRISEDTDIELVIYIARKNRFDTLYSDLDELTVLAKGIENIRKLQIIVITYNTYSVCGEKVAEVPYGAMLHGLGKCISKEKNNILFKGIDLDNQAEAEDYKEILVKCRNETVAYRAGGRYIEKLTEYSLEDQEEYQLRQDGVYLITGGLGGIGAELAKQLAKDGPQRKIILLGRKSLTSPKVDSELLRRWTEVKQVCRNVEYISCDIAEEEQVSNVFNRLYDTYPVIHGIFHAAGIPGGKMLNEISLTEMHDAMKAKVNGTVLLERATAGKELDFIILFSSIATVFGSAALTYYCAANAFLDAYSTFYNNTYRTRCMTINWATWSESGMSVKNDFTIDTLFKSIKNKEALEYFMCVLGKKRSNIIIGELNLENMISLTLKKYPYQYSDYIENAISRLKKTTAVSGSQTLRYTKADIKYSEIEKNIITICQELMGYEKIDINANFFELGADSILLNHMFNKLNTAYPNALKITDLFTNPSIVQLSEFLERKSGSTKKQEYEVQEIQEETDSLIAIIGVGINLPAAANQQEYWKMLKNGIDVIRTIPADRRITESEDTRFKCDTYKQIGYLDEIDKFDYSLFGISPNDAQLMDPVSRLFLQCCWSALEDAGCGGDTLKSSDTGVIMGYSANLANLYSRLLYEYDTDKFTASLAVNQISMMPSRISYIKDFHGPCITVDSACSSSLVAIHTACEWLRSNRCKTVLAGGAFLALSSYDNGMRIGYEASDCRTRVFSRESNGAAVGEGIGVVLLKRYSDALRDKDAVYAVIKGSALNQDGSSFGIAAPNLKAQADVISQAWDNAGINPEDISYIETHGTGTYLGDTIEFAGLQDAFDRYTDKKQFCAVGSVKTNMGHLNEASGMASLVKVLLMMKHHQIVPTLHNSYPNDNIDWINSSMYLADTGMQWEERNGKLLAGISAFGMSGTNCHIVLEGARPVVQPDCKKEKYYIILSGKSREVLYHNIYNLYIYLMKYSNDTMDAISYVLCCGRSHLEYRLAFLVRDRQQLEKKLAYLLEHFERQEEWEDIYYGSYHIVPETKKKLLPGDIYLKDKEKLEKENERLLQEEKNDISDRLLGNFVRGAYINFRELLKELKCGAHLPVYAFQRSRVWIGRERSTEERKELLPAYYHSKKWVALSDRVQASVQNRTILFIHWAENDMRDVITELSKKNIVKEWIITPSEVKAIEGKTILKGTSREDFKQAFMDEGLISLDQIIYVPFMADKNSMDFDEGEALERIRNIIEEECYNNCFFIPLHIVKAIADAHFDQRIELLVLVKEMNIITKTERYVHPHLGVVTGLAKVIEQEFDHIDTMILDADDKTEKETIINEILSDEREHYMLALRNGKRYGEILNEVNIKEGCAYVFDQKKGYVISGGTSGMGLEIALNLAEAGCTRLALISRHNPLKLKAGTEQGEMGQRIHKLKKLRELSPDLQVYECDVSDGAALRKVLDQIRKRFGKIDGIFHCAGNTKAGFILRKEEKDYFEILDVKIKGAMWLDYHTRQDNPDFMVLFSSAVTLIGEAGQCDYVAANSFLDSYVDYRNMQGRQTFCINWVSWLETGMSVRNHINVDGITKVIRTKDALDRLYDMMNSTVQKAIIGEINYESDMVKELLTGKCAISDTMKQKAGFALGEQTKERKKLLILPHSTKEEVKAAAVSRLKIKGKDETQISETERNIAVIYSKILGHSELDLYDNFFEMGGDSIMIMKMQLEIDKIYSGCVASTDLFEFTTIESLAAYIDRKTKQTVYAAALKEVLPEQSCGAVREEEILISSLSFAQRRIYIEEMHHKGEKLYNNPLAVVFDEKLSEEKIRKAIDRLGEQHQALRTSFEYISGSVKQVVYPRLLYQLDKLRVEDCDSIDLRHYLYDFELSKAPLLHAVLLEDEKKQILMLDVHHIILDGLSSSLLVRELVYLLKGEEPEEVRFDYLDFVQEEKEYLKSERYKADAKYWEGVLEKIKYSDTVGGDIHEADIKEYCGIYETLDKDLENSLQTIAKKYHISLFSVLLGAVYLAIKNLEGIDCLTIAIPALGRDKPEHMNIIGNFVNLLPINMKAEAYNRGKFYREVFWEVQNAMKHQMYPYNRIAGMAKNKYGIDKLYSIMFEYENSSMGLIEKREDYLCKGKSRVIYQTGERSQIDIKINYHNGNLVIGINYDKKTFSRQFIRRFYEQYLKVLQETLEDRQVSPDLKQGGRLTMENDEMMEQLKKMIAEKLSMDEAALEPEMDLFTLEEYDSLFIVELIMYFENELGLSIPEEYYALENYKTLSKIIETINKVKREIQNSDQDLRHDAAYIAAAKEE